MQVEGNDKYVDSGPPFLIFLHPALGPLWEVPRQKVCILAFGNSIVFPLMLFVSPFVLDLVDRIS